MTLVPETLEQALREWMAEVLGDPARGLEAVAIDGKTLCSTLAEHGRSIQLLALLDQHTGCVLSQAAVNRSGIRRPRDQADNVRRSSLDR